MANTYFHPSCKMVFAIAVMEQMSKMVFAQTSVHDKQQLCSSSLRHRMAS
jgi:hypothetical protein